MSTMTETVTASTPNSKADKKSRSRQTKVVILKLSSSLLARFAPAAPIKEDPEVKAEAEGTPAAGSTANSDVQTNGTPADNGSESASTPAPTGDAANGDATKKRGGPGPRGGVKRGPGDGIPRPRGRPGPKKRKLDDGTGEPTVRTSFGGVAPLTKLGPRANQGAINAGLRALDRSGAPCRKWDRKPFTLKSFTGVVWEVPSWKAPSRPELPNGDVNGTSGTGESEGKPNESSTGLQSEKSNQGEPNGELNGLTTPAASSPPAPTPAPAMEVSVET